MSYVGKVRAKFPFIAGVILASLAFICLLFGAIALGVFLSIRALPYPSTSIRWLGQDWYYLQLVWGVVGFVAFPLGLAGGFAALKGVHFRLVITGCFAALAWSLLAVEHVIFMSQRWAPYDAAEGFIFAFSVTLSAVLSMTMTAISKKQFT